MSITETFLQLTGRTYPSGTEHELLQFIPFDLNRDRFGNYYIQIGENPSCMFTSHFDTCSSRVENINHVFDGDFIRTDGSTILGADDKAGVTVMLYMIQHKVPGLYYFFISEEVGCVGSRALANSHRINKMPNIGKVISFDRRGTDSIITYQSRVRCCSENFAKELLTELNEKSLVENTVNLQFNYRADNTGVCTDSKSFMDIYPECTNISVGYYDEHRFTEHQNLKHLEKLARTAVLVDWEKLGVYRNPAITERM
jgi:putative aminopeptidase FrvX